MKRTVNSPRRTYAIATLLGVATMLGAVASSRHHRLPLPLVSPTPSASVSATLTGSCHAVNGLPDSGCTPGAVNPAVTQSTINQTICVAGYTATIRPPVSVTSPIKRERMAAYGYTDSPANYELDHLVALEDGGDPSSIQNLWPESYSGTESAHTKDHIENLLHARICSGQITLQAAQTALRTNWEAIK